MRICLHASHLNLLNEGKYCTERGKESKTVVLLKRGDSRKSCIQGIGVLKVCACRSL